MADKSLTIEQVLTMLEATPPRLAEFTADLTSSQLRTPPRPDEWSANEVLAHLRSCADIWGNCIETIIAQDTPTIRAVNPTTWIKQTDYPEQEFHASLQAFTGQRNKLLDILKPLPHESWARKATVTGAGKPLERTLFSYARWLATHERPHLKQIKRIGDTLRM